MTCERLSFPAGEQTSSGCIAKYQCKQLMFPESGHTLSPWVRCRFKDGEGREITVSNDSSPAIQNTAVIKSFDFGLSDGLHCKVVIHDQRGSSLTDFMRNLLKDLKLATPESLKFIVEWGWTKSGCPTPLPSARSACHYMILDSIETNFIGGKFIHELTGTDLVKKVIEAGVDKIYGGEGQNAITLKEAIRKLFTEDPKPYIGKVSYCRLEGGTVQCDVGFEYEKDGPKGKWIANGNDKLQTAIHWLSGHRSDRNRTFIPSYNSTDSGGEIIFWEDSKPKCAETSAWEENCLGTYIVNGGKASSVIEFSPKIRWDFARLTCVGGQISSETINPTPQAKAQGRRDCAELQRPNCSGSGQTLSTPTTETHKDNYGKKATDEAQKGHDEQARGMKLLTDLIEADLVIVGDPSLPTPGEGLFLRNIAIAYINPYHHLPQTESSCGDWIVDPVCNEILSNKAWLIKRCNHHIQEGNYTTTLGIYLTTPGVDVEPTAPLGASDTGVVV